MGAFLERVVLRLGRKDLIDLVVLEVKLETVPRAAELKEDMMFLESSREVGKHRVRSLGALVVGVDRM